MILYVSDVSDMLQLVGLVFQVLDSFRQAEAYRTHQTHRDTRRHGESHSLLNAIVGSTRAARRAGK